MMPTSQLNQHEPRSAGQQPLAPAADKNWPRILQAQKASFSPYAEHVSTTQDQQTWLERLVRRLVHENLAAGWELFRRRNGYDAVVTADYRTSLVFGALSRLLGRRSAHIVKELYLDEAVLASRLRRWVFRWALRSCDCVITNSSTELTAYGEYLGLPPERLRFLPWGSNLPLRYDGTDEGYVFAAGRSFRDWPLLFRVAGEMSTPFVVVAEAASVAGLRRPPNLTLHCDISRQRYLDLLRGARVVVVPLLLTVRSTGQAALLEGMSFAKPIVTADTPGVSDYVVPGENALLYPPGEARSLREQLEWLLRDPKCRQRLGAAGALSIASTFNKSRYAQQMLKLVRALLAVRSALPPRGHA